MKKILFLFLITLSSQSYALYYADRCAPAGGYINQAYIHMNYCYVGGGSQAWNPNFVSNGQVCEFVHSQDTGDGDDSFWDYYACPYGDDWNLYDTDLDGVANGVDQSWWDPTVPSNSTSENGSCTTDSRTETYSNINVDFTGNSIYSHSTDYCYYEVLSETSIDNSTCKIYDLQGTGEAADSVNESGGDSCSCDSGYDLAGEVCIYTDTDSPELSSTNGDDDLWEIYSFNSIDLPIGGHTGLFYNISFTDDTMTYDEAYSYFLQNADFSLFGQDPLYNLNGFSRWQVSGYSHGSDYDYAINNNIDYVHFSTAPLLTYLSKKEIWRCSQYADYMPVAGYVQTNNGGCISRMSIRRVQEEEEEEEEEEENPNPNPPSSGACDASSADYANCVGINSRLTTINESIENNNEDIVQAIESQNNDDIVEAIQALDFTSDLTDMTTTENLLGSINDKLSETESSTSQAHTTNDSSLDTYEKVNTNFYNRIKTSPIISSFSSVTEVFTGAGTCPQPSFDLTNTIIGNTFIFSGHCTLAEVIRTPISLIFTVVYSIVGFRILASA